MPPENFPGLLKTFQTTVEMTIFNANIFVYCVQKVFYDGGSPYGGSTASKASGSPLSPFQAEEKSEQSLSNEYGTNLCTK